MIFSKRQTGIFLSKLQKIFKNLSRYQLLTEALALYQDDSNFALSDSVKLAGFLAHINQIDTNGLVFNRILRLLSDSKVMEKAFSTLELVDNFLVCFSESTLSPQNKRSLLEWMVCDRMDALISNQAEALLCIEKMGNFLGSVDEAIYRIPEDQFYFLWRFFSEPNTIDLKCLNLDQKQALKNWLELKEKQHYHKLEQFMNALLLSDLDSALKEGSLDRLKRVVLERMITKELAASHVNACLLMIAQHEGALLAQCVNNHYEQNRFDFPAVDCDKNSGPIALVDIDRTLMNTVNSKNVYNFNLIYALKQTGIESIYLFSDMPCTRDILFFREQLIDVLRQEGIQVLGVMTPLDLVADLDLDEMVSLYEDILDEGRTGVLNTDLGSVIVNRLVRGLYPPLIASFYQERHALLHALESQDDIEEFDLSSGYPLELLRRMVNLIIDNPNHHRDMYHIKGFLFEQFLKYNTRYTKIYVIDDQPRVLKSVENIFEQARTNVTLTTIPVKSDVSFENIPVEKYVRRIECESYKKYSGRGERFLFKFSQIAVVSSPTTSILGRSALETRDIIYSLIGAYIRAVTEIQKKENRLALKMMLEFANAYYQEHLEAHVRYLIKKFPEFSNVLELDEQEVNDFIERYK